MKDRDFLIWIHARLVEHGDSPIIDFMHRLRAIIVSTPDDRETPNDGRGGNCIADVSGEPLLIKSGRLTSIQWHPAQEPPDDTITVLIAVAGEADALEGYHIAGRWRYSNEQPVGGRVYAWADMPDTPAYAMGKGRK